MLYEVITTAYTSNGFDLAATEIAGTYNYSLQLNSEFGCDSTIFLTLLVKDIPGDTTPEPDGNFNFSVFVITSYSIHYTKLYDW